MEPKEYGGRGADKVTRLLKPRKSWEQCLARPGRGKIKLGEKEATPHLPATCGTEKDTKVNLQGLGHSGSSLLHTLP